MKLLIGYTTREGQTRTIARHIADMAFDTGHSVEITALDDADSIKLSRFDAVLLAAPIHAGHYPKALGKFVSDHLADLNERPSRFVSVSLAAAGHDAEEWRSLDHIVDDFSEATGWIAADTKHVAGAYVPSRYDILTRFIMRRIISAKDPDAKPGEDKEYTDWADLNAWVTSWLNP